MSCKLFLCSRNFCKNFIILSHVFFQIDVFLYILEHDGACLAAAINAAGLALADARVPMYDIITSCSAAIIGDQIFLDPTESEEHLAKKCPNDKLNHGIITLSMLSELKQVSNINQIGSMDLECLTKVMDILEQECERIVPNIQKVLVMNVVNCHEQRKRLKEDSKEREALLDAKLEEWKKLIQNG